MSRFSTTLQRYGYPLTNRLSYRHISCECPSAEAPNFRVDDGWYPPLYAFLRARKSNTQDSRREFRLGRFISRGLGAVLVRLGSSFIVQLVPNSKIISIQTVPMTIFLFAVAVLNTIYLFSRIKLYRLHLRPDPVSSPNAKFVAAQLDFQPLEPPPLTSRIMKSLLFGFSTSWRFLLGMQPPAYSTPPPAKVGRVQQLEMWTPGELEMTLFNVYSPAHVFLWMATGSSNWILMFFIMGLVGAQVFQLPLLPTRCSRRRRPTR